MKDRRLSLEATLQHTGKLARALGRRHHWRLAATFAPGVTDTMLRSWFQTFFMEGERLPMCPKRRMLWLVEVRAGFRAQRNSLSVLLVSAALLREAGRLRHIKARTRRARARRTRKNIPPFPNSRARAS